MVFHLKADARATPGARSEGGDGGEDGMDVGAEQSSARKAVSCISKYGLMESNELNSVLLLDQFQRIFLLNRIDSTIYLILKQLVNMLSINQVLFESNKMNLANT
jgi:hypothetical protein